MSGLQLLAAISSHLHVGVDVCETLSKISGTTIAPRRAVCITGLSSRIWENQIRTAITKICVKEKEMSHFLAESLITAVKISDRTGIPLVVLIDRIKILYEKRVRQESLRQQAFAIPRATIRLFAFLPFLTLLGGEIMGSHPLHFLFSSSAGVICFVVGCVFTLWGIVWVKRTLHQEEV